MNYWTQILFSNTMALNMNTHVVSACQVPFHKYIFLSFYLSSLVKSNPVWRIINLWEQVKYFLFICSKCAYMISLSAVCCKRHHLKNRVSASSSAHIRKAAYIVNSVYRKYIFQYWNATEHAIFIGALQTFKVNPRRCTAKHLKGRIEETFLWLLDLLRTRLYAKIKI